jgi:hypothetical protein
MAEKRAELINEAGEVVNIIVIDTDLQWDPPEGHTVNILRKNQHGRYKPTVDAAEPEPTDDEA